MQLRKANITALTDAWYIWSVNTEDNSVSCLPYPNFDEDDDGLFVWDLVHFPLSAVLNAIESR